MSRSLHEVEFEVIEVRRAGENTEVGGRCLNRDIHRGNSAIEVYRIQWPAGLTMAQVAESPSLEPERIDIRQISPPATLLSITTYGHEVETLEPVYTGRILLQGDLTRILRPEDIIRFGLTRAPDLETM